MPDLNQPPEFTEDEWLILETQFDARPIDVNALSCQRQWYVHARLKRYLQAVIDEESCSGAVRLNIQEQIRRTIWPSHHREPQDETA